MEELKPCPFCKGKATTYQDTLRGEHFGHYVVCTVCGARLKRINLKDAIAAWNQRAERTCKVRQSYFDSDDELSELMEGIAFSPEDTVACICETCKHDWRYDRGIRPNFCPNCGAKVVE